MEDKKDRSNESQSIAQAILSLAANIRKGSGILNDIEINGVTYQKLIVKTGSYTMAVTASNSDYTNRELGVAKMPNSVLLSGITLSGLTVAWNAQLRGDGSGISNGATNLQANNLHVDSGSAQNVTFSWWAIGY